MSSISKVLVNYRKKTQVEQKVQNILLMNYTQF